MLSLLNKLARRLVHRRKTRGLTQAEAARRAGVSPSWLCQVETGARPPSRSLAQALETVYHVTPGAFTHRFGGFARVADGRTGRDARHLPLPAILVTRGTLSVLFWIQAPVRTWCTFRRVDFLALVCDGRRKMLVAVEVCMPGKDDEAQHRRRLELLLPVLRVPADRVGDANIVEHILGRLQETLQRA